MQTNQCPGRQANGILLSGSDDLIPKNSFQSDEALACSPIVLEAQEGSKAGVLSQPAPSPGIDRHLSAGDEPASGMIRVAAGAVEKGGDPYKVILDDKNRPYILKLISSVGLARFAARPASPAIASNYRDKN